MLYWLCGGQLDLELQAVVLVVCVAVVLMGLAEPGTVGGTGSPASAMFIYVMLCVLAKIIYAYILSFLSDLNVIS